MEGAPGSRLAARPSPAPPRAPPSVCRDPAFRAACVCPSCRVYRRKSRQSDAGVMLATCAKAAMRKRLVVCLCVYVSLVQAQVRD